MADIAVVTAVTGAYDHPRKDRIDPGDRVDYLFYADDVSSHLVEPPWRHRPLDLAGEHPRRAAKWPKLNPHRFAELRDYRFVVWIDGGVHIRSPRFVPEIIEHLVDGMVLSPHFDDRHDAYGEAEIRPPKYAGEPLDEQVAFYRRQGFPTDFGLFECGVLARDMQNPIVAELGALWQAQVDRFSYQDQVALPYCLWRLGYRPGVLPRSFRKMRWVKVNAHRREEQ